MANTDSFLDKYPKDIYKDLLQVPNENNGIDGTERTLMDGEGTESAMEISTEKVGARAGKTLLQGGSEITASASELNQLDGKILGTGAEKDTGASMGDLITWATNVASAGFPHVGSGGTLTRYSTSQILSMLGLPNATTIAGEICLESSGNGEILKSNVTNDITFGFVFWRTMNIPQTSQSMNDNDQYALFVCEPEENNVRLIVNTSEVQTTLAQDKCAIALSGSDLMVYCAGVQQQNYDVPFYGFTFSWGVI